MCTYWTVLMIMGLDWTGPIMLIRLFLVSHVNFLFISCGRLSWLPIRFLLHVKYSGARGGGELLLSATYLH